MTLAISAPVRAAVQLSAFIVAHSLACSAVAATVQNNQDFPFHQPVAILEEGDAQAAPGAATLPAQRNGKSIVFVANVDAKSTGTFKLNLNAAAKKSGLSVEASPDGITLSTSGQSVGKISWSLVLQPAPKALKKAARADADSDSGPAPAEEASYTHPDYAAIFQPLALNFKRTEQGPVFDRWHGESATQGLKLMLDVDCYADGFVDIKGALKNESAAVTSGVLCDVVARWEHPKTSGRSINYNSEPFTIGETTTTSFRAGAGHHLALQRGVDWVRVATGSGAIEWMNDFSESFSVIEEGSKKNPSKWINANQPQLGCEVQATSSAIYSITEITRPTIKRFRDRFAPWVLPPQGEQAEFASRIAISAKPLDDKQADQQFVGYTCYHGQFDSAAASKSTYHIGVPYVRFSTSYFPYSTLGENFDRYKLPGQDREGYWPLSADTVNHWQLLADDIRRDLRIARAMGFEVIRLHHLELIDPIDKETRTQYLDFLLGEMRHLGLKALMDLQSQPQDVTDLVKRYRAVIAGVEVENEVLIWGFKLDREKYWNSIYDAVKSAAPEIPVHLTASTNSGIFNRVEALSGHSDRIGFHYYVDTPPAIVSARDAALAVGNFASKVGRECAITEWNWRFMTRMPYEDRAKLYPRIVGRALESRSIQEFGQFQFTESLAMNPKLLGGIRHYDPLFLSRRPKPELFELWKLIQQYSNPAAPQNQVRIDYVTTKLDAKGAGTLQFRVTNQTSIARNLKLAVESPSNISARLAIGTDLKLGARQSATVDVALATTSSLPGFFHAFLRAEENGKLLTYGWGEARLAAKPKLDYDAPTTVTYPRGVKAELDAFDFTAPTTIVYGGNAPGVELEYALLLQNTLESATAQPVNLYNTDTLPAELKATNNLVLIGTKESNPLLPETPISNGQTAGTAEFVYTRKAETGKDWLIVTGTDSAAADEAAVDLTLRWWRGAKDSATRKLGIALVEKSLPKGSDPTKLP